MKLIIGLPNSGKTTYSSRFTDVIHFDSIPHKTPSEQFVKCNEMARTAKCDVCVEGVYNSCKRRTELLAAIKDKTERKICIWLDTPLDICLERERNYRHRPDSLVLYHAKHFEPPTLEEGWDEIHIIRDGNEEIITAVGTIRKEQTNGNA